MSIKFKSGFTAVIPVIIFTAFVGFIAFISIYFNGKGNLSKDQLGLVVGSSCADTRPAHMFVAHTGVTKESIYACSICYKG